MLNHKGTVTIETERLVLRRYRPDDADAMFANWANDERVTRFLTWTPHGTVDVTKAIIDDWCSRYENENYYNWVITLDGVPVGSIAAVKISDRSDSAELGYCLSPDCWGKGLMTEAARAVIAFLFDEVGVNRVEIGHATKNPASGKVAEKCGLTHEGTHREYFRSNSGELLDIAIWAILNREHSQNEK